MEHTIDAKGKKLGRVASEAAALLIGKNTVSFARNTIPTAKVKIINASKLDITARKIGSKSYKAYSGYPGGLKVTAMKKMVLDKGMAEPFRKAIGGMLPKNKLKPLMMKNLIITE